VGAKLRQFLPAIAAHLRSKGWDVQTIRLKVRVR
jgi:ethanolamine ammonia-lyase small subunit